MHISQDDTSVTDIPRDKEVKDVLELEKGKLLYSFTQFYNDVICFCERDNHEFYKGIFVI